MAKVARAALVDAAQELNKKLKIDPPIDVKLSTGELSGLVDEAGALLREDDEISAETQAVIDALAGNGGDAEGEKGGDEDGEVKTAAKRTSAKTAAAPKEPKEPKDSVAGRIEAALLKGGTVEAIASKLSVPKSAVKAVHKHRTNPARRVKFVDASEGDIVKISRAA